jgi:hypothetical protein
MEVPERESNPPIGRWASFLGTFVAMLTLVLPVVAISCYSSSELRETSNKVMILGDSTNGMILGKP